jgi:hypothetical protein
MELALLDSGEHLYLRELSEPRDNSLQLVVQEAVVNRSGLVGSHHPELPELIEILKDASPIESTDACQIFELTSEALRGVPNSVRCRIRFVLTVYR